MVTKTDIHAHGCRRCRTRYEDICDQRTDDNLCPTCRGMHVTGVLVTSRGPRTCCLTSRLTTKEEKTTYHLAGRSNWHICPTCKRTHPGPVKTLGTDRKDDT